MSVFGGSMEMYLVEKDRGALDPSVHGGHIGRLKVHPWNYFCIFHSFEHKLCRMVELCIPKNRMIFVFRF